jgi:hypothetical protein
MAMMAITTSSSMSVNPLRLAKRELFGCKIIFISSMQC